MADVDDPGRIGVVISCEHAGHRIPAPYQPLFRGARKVLESHRGWDPGALDLARTIARSLGAPLVAATVSRLLVECNRSPDHPRVFSEFTRALSRTDKQHLLRVYYHPHRGAVEAVVRSTLRDHGTVLHLGVHTFTPVLNGRRRDADAGLLYDPRRPLEARLCEEWMHVLELKAPGLRVRRNYPYRGWSDGLTTTLRTRFPAKRYLGIELELNQTWVGAASWPRIRKDIAASLEVLVSGLFA